MLQREYARNSEQILGSNVCQCFDSFALGNAHKERSCMWFEIKILLLGKLQATSGGKYFNIALKLYDEARLIQNLFAKCIP